MINQNSRSAQIMRKYFYCTCIMIIVTSSNLCSASNIDQIQISTNVAYSNNVLGPQPYGFEIWLNGDLTDVLSVTVSTPSGSNISTIGLVKDFGNGAWFWDESVGYGDLTSLQADFGTGDYVIDFYNGSNALIDSATLSYSPTLPTGFAAISNPVPGNDMPFSSPLFTWNDTIGFGSFLEVNIDDATGVNKIYESFLSIDTTSWAPGDLMPGSDYFLNVSVDTVNGLSIIGGIPTLPIGTSANGDQFAFAELGRYSNEIFFSTSAVPVPSAMWLFGSGLLGLIGVARRKAA